MYGHKILYCTFSNTWHHHKPITMHQAMNNYHIRTVHFIRLSYFQQRRWSKVNWKILATKWCLGQLVFVTLGSPLNKWLFSEPPDLVLKSDSLFMRFHRTIQTNMKTVPTANNTHFEATVSQPFWNFLLQSNNMNNIISKALEIFT